MDLLYIDKTEYIHKIIRNGGCMLLTRPRRFGKSLLLGAMGEVLKGNRELFKGLWIDSAGYDFKKYPVVKLTMSGGCGTKERLEATIMEELRAAAQDNAVALEGETPGIAIKKLVENIKLSTAERVAVLIDEYDAPIQSQIHDINQAKRNSLVLHDFHLALKTLADDGQLRVLFVTGVTRFAEDSNYQVMSYLDDLTMNPAYNEVCGFTVEEFDAYFTEYLPGMLEYIKSLGFIEPGATVENLRERILDYFDGYSWDGHRRVLNPFSLIKCIAAKKLKPFWSLSATPTLLFELIRKIPLEYVESESPVMCGTSLDAVGIASQNLTPLLFQTGYLTVERRIGDGKYLLTGPNLEVDQAFNTQLLKSLTGQKEDTITSLTARIQAALEDFDSDALGAAFSQILNWRPSHGQPAMEGFHLAMIFAALKARHFKVSADISDFEGRFDILIPGRAAALFIGAIKIDISAAEPNQDNEATRRELLLAALNRAKALNALRRPDEEYPGEYPVFKRLAVAIVGQADVVTEIY
jgi:hypothetical protein